MISGVVVLKLSVFALLIFHIQVEVHIEFSANFLVIAKSDCTYFIFYFN